MATNLNLCLFCATPCCPSPFIIVNGQLTRVKHDKKRGEDDPDLEDDHDNYNFIIEENSSLLGEQIKVIFILKKILGIKEQKLYNFLGKLEGQLHPEFWFQVCISCRKAVRNCFDILKEIALLQKRFSSISSELKGLIKETREKHEKVNVANKNIGELLADSIWREIRQEVAHKVQCYKFKKGSQTFYRCALGCPAEYPCLTSMRQHVKLHSQKSNAFPCELCGWIIGGFRSKEYSIDHHNFFIHHFGSNPTKKTLRIKRPPPPPTPPPRPPKRPRVARKLKRRFTYRPSRQLKTKPTMVSVNGFVKTVPVEVSDVDVDPLLLIENEDDHNYNEQERFMAGDFNADNVNGDEDYDDHDEPGVKIIKIEEEDLPAELESQNESELNEQEILITNPRCSTPILTKSASYLKKDSLSGHFKCLLGCPAQFESVHKLNRHLKLHSPGANATRCELCGWLGTPAFIKTHINLHRPFSVAAAEILKTSLPPRPTTVRKDRITEDNEDYTKIQTGSSGSFRYKCKKCPLLFTHVNQLIPHLELHKPGSGAVTCEICKWVMAPDKVELHNQNHHRKEMEDQSAMKGGPSNVEKSQVEN